MLVLGVCLALFIWHTGQDHEPPAEAKKQETSVLPLDIKGLSYTTRDKGRLIAKIEADQLKVSRRRFWVFNIKPVNEAVLTNARLEFHVYDDMPSKVDLLSTARSILTLDESGRTATKGLGLITRGSINGLEIRIYRADRLFLLLNADRARIDFRRKKISMSGVSLRDLFAERLIRTNTALWDNTAKVLRIPGTYTAEGPHGTTAGKGMDFDLGSAVNNNVK